MSQFAAVIDNKYVQEYNFSLAKYTNIAGESIPFVCFIYISKIISFRKLFVNEMAVICVWLCYDQWQMLISTICVLQLTMKQLNSWHYLDWIVLHVAIEMQISTFSAMPMFVYTVSFISVHYSRRNHQNWNDFASNSRHHQYSQTSVNVLNVFVFLRNTSRYVMG